MHEFVPNFGLPDHCTGTSMTCLCAMSPEMVSIGLVSSKKLYYNQDLAVNSKVVLNYSAYSLIQTGNSFYLVLSNKGEIRCGHNSCSSVFYSMPT